MRPVATPLVCAAAALVLLANATRARADDEAALPPSPEPTGATLLGASDARYLFEIAARSGYTTPPIRGGVNDFGAGFGARAGVDVWRLYLGATMMAYLGGSDVTATDQALLAGVEVGFNGQLGRYLTLRPLFGLGDTILTHTEPGASGPSVDVVTSASGSSSSSSPASTSTSVKNLYLQPGLTAILSYRRFFAAAGGGLLILPGIVYGPAPAQETTWICYSLEGQLGFRL